MTHKRIGISKKYEDLKARKGLTRGTCTVAQNETGHMVHCGALVLPERQGKYFPGSNQGTSIPEVTLPTVEQELKMTCKKKREIYTSRFRKHTSGAKTKQAKRKDDTIEMFTFWNKSIFFWLELLHRFFVDGVLDYTIGSGVFAEACLLMKVHYFGMAMSAAHKRMIESRMQWAAIRYMCDPSVKLHFEPRCAMVLKSVHAQVKSKPLMTVEQETTPKKKKYSIVTSPSAKPLALPPKDGKSAAAKKQEAEAKKKAAQAKQKLEKSGEDETPPSPSAAPKAKSKKAGSKKKATKEDGGDSGAGSAGTVEDSDWECSD